MEVSKEPISTLNELIETCKDGEQGFRAAAENVKRGDLQKLFNEYSQQRAQFANELTKEVTRMGGKPEKSGTVSGTLHRGWMEVKSAVAGKDDHAILNEAEKGEDSTVKAYQNALGKQIPTDLRAIVEREYQLVQQAHNQIRSLRDRREQASTAPPAY